MRRDCQPRPRIATTALRSDGRQPVETASRREERLSAGLLTRRLDRMVVSRLAPAMSAARRPDGPVRSPRAFSVAVGRPGGAATEAGFCAEDAPAKSGMHVGTASPTGSAPGDPEPVEAADGHGILAMSSDFKIGSTFRVCPLVRPESFSGPRVATANFG